jgi:hypothetical protein
VGCEQLTMKKAKFGRNAICLQVIGPVVSDIAKIATTAEVLDLKRPVAFFYACAAEGAAGCEGAVLLP